MFLDFERSRTPIQSQTETLQLICICRVRIIWSLQVQIQDTIFSGLSTFGKDPRELNKGIHFLYVSIITVFTSVLYITNITVYKVLEETIVYLDNDFAQWLLRPELYLNLLGGYPTKVGHSCFLQLHSVTMSLTETVERSTQLCKVLKMYHLFLFRSFRPVQIMFFKGILSPSLFGTYK